MILDYECFSLLNSTSENKSDIKLYFLLSFSLGRGTFGSRMLGDLQQMHLVEPLFDPLSSERNDGALVGVE